MLTADLMAPSRSIIPFMRKLGVFRILFASWAVLTVLATARVASAQTVALSTLVTRSVPRRNPSLNPDDINFADCVSDAVLSYTATVTNQGSNDLQVWATGSGADCTQTSARTSGSTAACWQV